MARHSASFSASSSIWSAWSKFMGADARAAGASYAEVGGALGFDLDTPDDLLAADLTGMGHEAGR